MYIRGRYSILDENPKLWRYMSFSKFQNLITTSSLYFCRLDQFEDKLECTQPKGSLKFAIATENPWQIYERQYMDAKLHMFRNITFVNCWHINEAASPYMWKNYATLHGNEGVAIETDLDSLKKAIDGTSRKITDMRISYIDFETHYLEYFMGNPFDFVAVKDKQFKPENELRLVTIEDEYPDISEDDVLYDGSKQYCHQAGEFIPVDLRQLILRVHLAPNSTARFEQIVKDLINRMGLSIEIEKSCD